MSLLSLPHESDWALQSLYLVEQRVGGIRCFPYRSEKDRKAPCSWDLCWGPLGCHSLSWEVRPYRQKPVSVLLTAPNVPVDSDFQQLGMRVRMPPGDFSSHLLNFTSVGQVVPTIPYFEFLTYRIYIRNKWFNYTIKFWSVLLHSSSNWRDPSLPHIALPPHGSWMCCMLPSWVRVQKRSCPSQWSCTFPFVHLKGVRALWSQSSDRAGLQAAQGGSRNTCIVLPTFI